MTTTNNLTISDFRGKTVTKGSLIAYPVRNGSNVTMKMATVTDILMSVVPGAYTRTTLKVVRKNKQLTLTNIDNIVKIGK